MKILVEHDQQGTIKSIGVRLKLSNDAVSITLRASPGYEVTEFDAPQVKSTAEYDQLREIKRGFRVEAHSGGHRLVRKA